MVPRHPIHQTLLILFLASLVLVPGSRARAQQARVEGGLSAQTVIFEQLDQRLIDYDTSLVYRACALFDDSRLPADLASSRSLGEDHAFFAEARRFWPQLPEETQDLLTPFVARPADSRRRFFTTEPDSEAASVRIESAEEPATYEESIPSLDAHYYSFSLGSDVREMTLDFSSLTPDGALDVDILVNIREGRWEQRRLLQGEATTICRDVASDDVGSFFLVLSNHDLRESTTERGAFTIRTVDSPCA